MSGPRIAAVVLAAGLSSRLPGNKLLQPIAGRPVIRHVVEAALGSRSCHVQVVIGHEAERLRAALSDLPVAITENQDYSNGLSTSLKCGVRRIPTECDGALILLGDMPFVSVALLDRLIAHYDPAAGREICIPVSEGKRGNPVLWGRRFFDELLTASGDKGGKFFIDLHQDSVAELEVGSEAVLIDIDTANDLERLSR